VVNKFILLSLVIVLSACSSQSTMITGMMMVKLRSNIHTTLIKGD